MTEGTWAEGTLAEGNWFVKDQGPWRRGCCRFLAYSRPGTLKRFSIFKVPPRWDFPALSPESLPVLSIFRTSGLIRLALDWWHLLRDPAFGLGASAARQSQYILRKTLSEISATP